MIQGCFVTRRTSFDGGCSRENNEKSWCKREPCLSLYLSSSFFHIKLLMSRLWTVIANLYLYKKQ